MRKVIPELLVQVSRFQKWADTLPEGSRCGEWECDYDSWGELYDAVRAFLERRPVATWSGEETKGMLFAIARDNECERIARLLRDEHPHLLVPLARAAISMGERDDRWQIAEQLGHVGKTGDEEEAVLLLLMDDEHEYVRRRTLCALARIGSSFTEEAVARTWERNDPAQEYGRMMCLWSLHRIGSCKLEAHLAQAELDPRPYLRGYAARVRRGEVDP